MPLPEKRLSPHRVQFEKNLSNREVQQLADDFDLQILQCDSPVDSRTWDRLDGDLFQNRPEIELRVFGFYSSVYDLSFVHRLPHVRRFSADRLMRGTGVEHLATMEQLEWLSVDIFNLENFEFLQGIPNKITKLSLGPTRSKKPQLHDLCRFRSLKTLYLEGQQQGIEVLSDLLTLEELTLRSITTKGLHFIANLPRLWSLDIKLGGIRDLSAIGGKESVKYLELWQVRGLADLSAVSSLMGLQYLFLQSLRNVTAIPDLSKLQNLRRIYLENMKGLKDVKALHSAPALEEFIQVSAQNMEVEDYKYLLEIPTLKRVLVGFESDRKNQTFKDMAASRGIHELSGLHSKPFAFS
jgi:hypothetical protein